MMKILKDSELTKNLPKTVNEVSILFCSDQEIRVLNRDFRNKDKSTDVLSFSQIENLDFVSLALGDIIISVDTALVQANELNVSLDDEVLRLSIHGLLHLLGYDHENVSEIEAKKMRDLEEKLFLEVCDD